MVLKTELSFSTAKALNSNQISKQFETYYKGHVVSLLLKKMNTHEVLLKSVHCNQSKFCWHCLTFLLISMETRQNSTKLGDLKDLCFWFQMILSGGESSRTHCEKLKKSTMVSPEKIQSVDAKGWLTHSILDEIQWNSKLRFSSVFLRQWWRFYVKRPKIGRDT